MALKIGKKDEKGVVKGQLTDAVFCYVKMQDGDFKFESDTDKEYSVALVVDKTTAKAFKKQFPKNGYKEVDTADFQDRYKIEAPFPKQEEQYVITLRVDVALAVDIPKAKLRAGDPIPYNWPTRPKIYERCDGGVKDITMSKLVANGSKGKVNIKIRSNKYGQFPTLLEMLVEEMIEYEPQDSEPTSGFGEVVGGYDEEGDPKQKANSHDLDDDEDQEDETANEDDVDEDDDAPF